MVSKVIHQTCYNTVVHKVSALLDDSKKQEFHEEIIEEYEDIRDEHYQSLKVVLHSHTPQLTSVIIVHTRIINVYQ